MPSSQCCVLQIMKLNILTANVHKPGRENIFSASDDNQLLRVFFMLMSGCLCWSITAAYGNGADAVLFCHLKDWLICVLLAGFFPESESGWKSPNLLIHTWILRTVGSIVKPMKKLNIFSPAFFPHHLSWYAIQEDTFLKLLNNHAFRKLLKMHSMSNLMFVCPEVTTTHSSLYVIHYLTALPSTLII